MSMSEGYVSEYRDGFSRFEQKDRDEHTPVFAVGRITTGIAFGYAYEVNESDFEAAAQRLQTTRQHEVEASARPISATIAGNVTSQTSFN
jgi:hypothetical protein